MSYYPILEAPHCSGRTTLYNFSPNNWENINRTNQYVYLSFIRDGEWWHTLMGDLPYGQYQVVDSNNDLLSKDGINLLSLSEIKLPSSTATLPKLVTSRTNLPNWRATIELYSDSSKTSYQGEINPFPSKASLLTFSTFLQFDSQIENYILLTNLEVEPINRQVLVEIYDAKTKEIKSTEVVFSNKINIIPLNDKGLNSEILPVIICREMAAIPLYFSCTNHGEYLSLEHTHAPASLVVHGDRYGVQRRLKEYWFSVCNPS